MLQDAFGCVVANRFGGLLDDEADPFDLISEVEREKEKKKKEKKEDEDKKSKKKKPGLRESQRNRRLPVASGGLDLVPGEPHHRYRHRRGPAALCWQLLVFLQRMVVCSGCVSC